MAVGPKCVNGYTMFTPESALIPIAAAAPGNNGCSDLIFRNSDICDSLLFSLIFPDPVVMAELPCRETVVSDS
jgi:hypothetical protein